MGKPEQRNGETCLGPNGCSSGEGAGHIDKQQQRGHVVDHIKVPDMETVAETGHCGEQGGFDGKADL